MRWSAALVCSFALVATGCGNNASGTSPSSTTSAASTERFDAIVNPGAAAFYSFQVTGNGGSVAINLASLSALARPGVLPIVMELGYGVPVGEGCSVRKSVETGPGLTAQLTDTIMAGIYCANIADIGNLREPANFSIRITHP
jgi:hypothetical protein